MCARLLACPLCSQPSFLTLDALRAGLVSVATRPLMCPVCNEVLVGIDKLTIHLFGHTINIDDNSVQLSKPININIDNNEISNPNVQVKSIVYNWNVLRKEPVDTGQGFIKKDKSKNCCGIDHTMQSCCTISNSTNKASTVNSLTKVQIDGSFNKSSQALHMSEQIYPNTSTNECFYSKENDRLFIESHDDSTKVISELSKKNCLEDCYKGNNVEEENLQRREMNKLEDVWTENLSQQETEINNDDYNLKNNLIISFPNVMTINDNVNVLPLEINSKEHLDDHKNTLIDSIIDVKSDHNVNGEKIISNVKMLKEKTERCNICGFHFTDRNILHLHKQLIHMIDEQNLNPINDNLLKSYSCHLCSKVFKMRGSLMIHMRVAHIGHNWGFLSKDGDTSMGINNNGYNCPTCGKNFKKEQHVIQHLKTHEGKQWECDVCSKMFTTKYFLKKHKRLHSGEMPYKCNICDKTFTFQQSYHKHRLYHKDDKPHMCNTCGRSFKELSTLHNHERIHTGEKPFACETCGKCFRQRVSYLVHRRIHTGVMPYTCTMCGKSFRYKVSQRTHKCPIQPSNSQLQSNETVQTLTQEISNEPNQLQENNSTQQMKQVLNGINDKDNKFVLIINAQGQTVLTRESDLQNEQEANFIKPKETNKNSNEDAWNSSDSSKNFETKSSINNTNKLFFDNRNNVQEPTDFFSLVMSPLENDLSSPTTGMEHLRLSSPISKDVSQSLFSNFRQLPETINENIINTDVQETYTTDDNIRCSFETINEESLKQLLYSIVRDKILFHILKTRGCDVSAICDKMKFNIKNITTLTEEELCELWYHVKVILLNIQKRFILQSDNAHSKEKQQALKLIRTITAMALETLLQKTFLPNLLLQIVLILHSVILPEINNTKVKDEISHLLESWWKFNMIWKKKMIINVIKYLIIKSKISSQYVKRLYEIRSALSLIKHEKDIQMLVELSQDVNIISMQEGRAILLKLFTLGEEFITGIHNNVKAVLEIAETEVIKKYANLYAEACLNGTNKNKKVIIDKCLKNIIFHCLRSRRDFIGRDKLGRNLLVFLETLHRYKSDAIKNILYDQYESLLWEHLKAPGSCVRCNTAEVLFIIYSTQPARLMQNKNNINIFKQYSKAISYLLEDNDLEVCLIAINITCKILEYYWKQIPDNIIKQWLNILSYHMQSKSSSEIKLNILNGIKKMISNKYSHTNLQRLLSDFANNINYADTSVIKRFNKLLVYLENNIGILISDIIDLNTLLKYIENTDEQKLLQQLNKLLCLWIKPNNANNDNIIKEIIYIGAKNIKATRKFFYHSKHIIHWKDASKLVNIILMNIEKQINSLLNDDNENEINIKPNKRFKRNNHKSVNVKSIKDMINDDDVDECESIVILLEVISIILYANQKYFTEEYFEKKDGKDLKKLLTNILPQIKLTFNESILFLLSFAPVTTMNNPNDICNTFAKQLSNPNISNNTLITILYTLTKWNKVDMIFMLLKELIRKCKDSTTVEQESNNNVIKEQEKTLTLSIKILKQLLNINLQEELLTNYYEDLISIWNDLCVILRCHVEYRLKCSRELINLMDEHIFIDLFKDYLSMIFILFKIDDNSECFQNILLWIEEKVILQMPTMEEHKKHKFPINILKIVIEVCNSIINECQLSTKICCKIIIIYLKSIILSVGIIFLEDAFTAIIALLNLNKIQYDNKDSNLLNTILPKFLSAVMISLNKYSEDVIISYTNNLKIFTLVIEKYFDTIESTYSDPEMHATYLTIILNAAIDNISKEINDNVNKCSTVDMMKIKFPYLADKILKLTLYVKKYQDACLFSIKQAVIHYKEVDILSTLLIINDMFNLPVKSMKKIARRYKCN
ncbi:hypothetical protein M0802_011150 [Mischocyttarus mexicanus]|nr:hypothetical protein M0802_011150 [Mischocyttarus mexicanus]